MKGYSLSRKHALELLVKLYKILDYSVDVVVRCKISLGVQYLRLGFSGKSGAVLSEADQWTKKEAVSTATKLEWNLAYTEYLISTGEGNLSKGTNYLGATHDIVENDPTVLAAAASGAKIQHRVELNRLVSRACYVSSLLALNKGSINTSIALARRSLKLIQRAWAGLEALAKLKSSTSADGKADSGILTYTTTAAALSGPFLWPIVRSIYDTLIHVASLYLHQGMQREAVYYLKEARVVAEAVDSKSLLFHILSIFGDLNIRLGMLEEGEEKLQQAILLKEQLLEKGKELVSFDCTLGIMYRKNKSWARELDAYNNAEKTLDTLMRGKIAQDEDKVFGDITEKIANLQIIDAESKPKGKPVKVSRGTKKKPVLKTVSKAPTVQPQQASKAPSTNQCAGLVKLRDDVLRLKAVNLAIQQKWDLAQSLLKETANSSLGSRELVAQRLAVARSSLLQALSAIEEDDEFHTLHETAIVIPSAASVKILEAAPVKSGKRTPKKAAVVTKPDVNEFAPPSRAALLLHDARDNILAVQALAATLCSTTTLNVLSTMLGEVICLLAAITSESGISKTIPAINSLELYRSISLSREKSAIEAEKIEMLEAEDLRWPNLPQFQLEIDTSSILNFQNDYVDIIPPTWAAVSISLGESREELFFTRYQAGQMPFMVRVPLVVSGEMAIDEEQFGFEKGLATFYDIIKRANVSTHSAKDMITKDIRAKWWMEREALDNELHDLLLNVENNWLRGYRGIFGGYKRHPDLIARFNASFVKILNQHLPSRNSGNKKKNNKIVTLDERVVELFLGIGDPNQEDVDLEDSIQDLIYLVIDILHFHGEKNAADEVDLDEMIVLITDALESYHKAVDEYDEATIIEHTVLILDKSVHVLPWESLPCLDGKSVSRLPSLSSLRERLEMLNFIYEKNAGLYINRSNTGYILNPALDLTNTQKTYEEGLKSMPGWEGLTGKTPSDIEFARYLDEKELFLYFGHGSGAQYIKPRMVKKLSNCAVSLLMGCSSGKLTDAGEFEPYGMPLNYLQGGCPAVVVTLWDVTDKDIDKYSSKVFEEWGLFKEEKGKKSSKGKGKLKVKHDEESTADKPNSGTSSLCLAAATSRNVCRMRYLNGAAPVVYGVPVYFK
ncbi:Separin [Dactylellina cionopaga]|nr:Separin [Dactylellina cionopaga]